MTTFVPARFEVPVCAETSEFRLRMLTVHDLVKDYEAVMSSVRHLRGVFGPNHGPWPESLTLEQNLVDLGWHQKEFQRRSSFAYTVVTPDEKRCLGCTYLYPSDRRGYEAKLILWARESELASGLEERLFLFAKEWLRDCWPFEKVAFPGRVESWEEWLSLPLRGR